MYITIEAEILVPAVYTGTSGAILDICIKIPVEDMTAFLKKWSKNLRLSLRSQEDFEQMEADNPCSIDFETEMCLNEIPLQQRMRSPAWLPKNRNSLFRLWRRKRHVLSKMLYGTLLQHLTRTKRTSYSEYSGLYRRRSTEKGRRFREKSF